jgi:hypothetical protein
VITAVAALPAAFCIVLAVAMYDGTSEHAPQVWRAHRAQFFQWKQQKGDNGSDAGDSRATVPNVTGGAAVRAITMQLEVCACLLLRSFPGLQPLFGAVVLMRVLLAYHSGILAVQYAWAG